MPYPATAIANYFLKQAEAEGKQLDPMKLQKLIYYAHGWYLAITNQPLINEQVQAWKFGPVISSVYHEFKKFGSGPITERARGYAGETVEVPESDLPVAALLNRVWEVYGKLSGIQLSNMTHEDGAPWQKAREGNDNLLEIAIANEAIKQHFIAKAQAHKQSVTSSA